MTPKFLNRRMAYCRRLVAMRMLPNKSLLILDSMAYAQGRDFFADTLICSYDDLTRALRIGRNTVSECLKRLVAVGLIHRRHRWMLVEWSRGKRWVQRENEYRFVPDNHCEFPPAPQESKKKVKSLTTTVELPDATESRRALAEIAQRRLAVIFGGKSKQCEP